MSTKMLSKASVTAASVVISITSAGQSVTRLALDPDSLNIQIA